MDFEKVLEFVKDTCKGRDESHGLSHMIAVAETAKKILPTSASVELSENVRLVALLHDVADKKYDTDGTLQQRVDEFIRLVRPVDFLQIRIAISAISFSTEKSRGKRWYVNLLSPEWLQVRDIVSDADKIQALGRVGFQRCYEYTQIKNLGLSESQILDKVFDHCNDKLFHLEREYIGTLKGKDLAKKETFNLMRSMVSFSDKIHADSEASVLTKRYMRLNLAETYIC